MNDFKYLPLYKEYYKRHILSNNQICDIRFCKEEKKKYTDYYVVFCIANKKRQVEAFLNSTKGSVTDLETGKCGLEGLLWCKKQIFLFEDFLKEKGEKARIIVFGADNRRFKVYKWALMKKGYKLTNVSMSEDYNWGLIKNIN